MNNAGDLLRKWTQVRQGLDRVIIGQDKVKDHVLEAVLAGGHVLLEGVPGTGKTLLALALARLLGSRAGRIQFTPDLMPVDLLGTNVFNEQTRTFEFHEGPIFCDILLADEVNRTPPRTQSALLEGMQERAVTIDGKRREISKLFFVIATQNPVEFEGTYPLPEAQRDRFMMKVPIPYPSAEEEGGMLAAYARGDRLHESGLESLQPVLTLDEIVQARAALPSLVHIEEGLLRYILEIVRRTREDAAVQIGAGPRASLALMDSARARAALQGRDFLSPDDVKLMAEPVLAHRITLSPEAEMEGFFLEDLLHRIFEQVEVPR